MMFQPIDVGQAKFDVTLDIIIGDNTFGDTSSFREALPPTVSNNGHNIPSSSSIIRHGDKAKGDSGRNIFCNFGSKLMESDRN